VRCLVPTSLGYIHGSCFTHSHIFMRTHLPGLTRSPHPLPQVPTAPPTDVPTRIPSEAPTVEPTAIPSFVPSHMPTNYACFDGDHGCDLSSTMAVSYDAVSCMCQCLEGYVRVDNCQTCCTGTTAPTGVPTAEITLAPSAAPSLPPTVPPSPAPIASPTPFPTHAPTSHPCDDGGHLCDLSSTYCARSDEGYTCECRESFIRFPESPCELCCRASLSPSTAPTIPESGPPTDAPSFTPSAQPTLLPSVAPTKIPTELITAKPSNAPTHVPTSTECIMTHGCDTQSTRCETSADGFYVCVCLEGYVSSATSDIHCLGTPGIQCRMTDLDGVYCGWDRRTFILCTYRWHRLSLNACYRSRIMWEPHTVPYHSAVLPHSPDCSPYVRAVRPYTCSIDHAYVHAYRSC
jgi:hypothetical protein